MPWLEENGAERLNGPGPLPEVVTRQFGTGTMVEYFEVVHCAETNRFTLTAPKLRLCERESTRFVELNDANAHLLGSKRIVRIAASRPRLKCKRFFS